MIVIDTPEGIRFAGMLQVAYALALEVTTGMRHSRVSWLNVAREQGWTSRQTKRGALRDVVKAIQSVDPTWEPKGSIVTALAP